MKYSFYKKKRKPRVKKEETPRTPFIVYVYYRDGEVDEFSNGNINAAISFCNTLLEADADVQAYEDIVLCIRSRFDEPMVMLFRNGVDFTSNLWKKISPTCLVKKEFFDV